MSAADPKDLKQISHSYEAGTPRPLVISMYVPAIYQHFTMDRHDPSDHLHSLHLGLYQSSFSARNLSTITSVLVILHAKQEQVKEYLAKGAKQLWTRQ